uniref:Pathogen-like protein n=1 Tax=Nicotiana benthamiana TaxID=4100 RepID=A0A172WBY3_NICBE|nr:pathogen-like protein [Nicotiana benthamiana]
MEGEKEMIKVASDKYRKFLHEEQAAAAGSIQWRHEGSLEETVQNAIKSWEMELSHKTRVKDFRTINPEKFKLFVNEEFKYYKADEESFESSHDAFRSAFPRGFAWEVINVYTAPPLVTFKFRHWGFFEGPFKGHAPTNEMVHFYGVGIMKVDESLRAEDVEIYYDPAELFAGLLKGPSISESNIQQQEHSNENITTQQCPYQN